MANLNYNSDFHAKYRIECGGSSWRVFEIPERNAREGTFSRIISTVKRKFWLSVLMLFIFALVGLSSASAALPEPSPTVKDFAYYQATESKSSVDGDVTLLARYVEQYAADESYRAQVAVASVVLNRVEDASFPNTLASVLYQSYAFPEFTKEKFSKPGETALNAARDAMNGWDPSGSALFFIDTSKNGDEALSSRAETTSIGKFKFYS